MKNITLEQFKPQMDDIIFRVMETGDIYTVDCDSKGKFVVMEEPQYQVMLDALKTVMAAATMDEKTVQAILAAGKKAGINSDC